MLEKIFLFVFWTVVFVAAVHLFWPVALLGGIIFIFGSIFND